MDQSPTSNNGATAERSLSELAKDLSNQTTELVHKEVELAKAELTQKGKQLGIGVGAFGGAGVLGFYAFGALTAAMILALAELVDGWLAALIVTVLYATIAGVMALIGRNRVQRGSPPLPERAIESAKQDMETAKRSAKEARA